MTTAGEIIEPRRTSRRKKPVQSVHPEIRPDDYVPQQGSKATLSLADFTDDNIFAELRRRGYNGELRRMDIKVV